MHRVKTPVYVEIDPALKAEFAAFADDRDSTFTDQLQVAMRRHLAYPPPVDVLTPIPTEKKVGKIAKKTAKSP